MRAKATRVQIRAAAVCLSIVLPTNAAAFLFPLQETEVREAYFLGSTDHLKAAKFLGQYVRVYPQPAKGAWVYKIDFQTPYEEIVRRSWQQSVGYSAQQAQKDYYAQPDLVIVRVLISYAPSYGSTLSPEVKNGQPAAKAEDFWHEFAIQITQSRPIEPKAVNARPLFSRYVHGPRGAEVVQEFSAEQFAAEMVNVEVTTPDGQKIHAQFDLGKLK